MIKNADINENQRTKNFFFEHFRKLLTESNVYAKFQIHKTCIQKVNLWRGVEVGEESSPCETNEHEKAYEEWG